MAPRVKRTVVKYPRGSAITAKDGSMPHEWIAKKLVKNTKIPGLHDAHYIGYNRPYKGKDRRHHGYSGVDSIVAYAGKGMSKRNRVFLKHGMGAYFDVPGGSVSKDRRSLKSGPKPGSKKKK